MTSLDVFLIILLVLAAGIVTDSIREIIRDVLKYHRKRRAVKQEQSVTTTDDEGSWFMLSPDNRTVECVYCPTAWPVHPGETPELFATLRQHGREHAG